MSYAEAALPTTTDIHALRLGPPGTARRAGWAALAIAAAVGVAGCSAGGVPPSTAANPSTPASATVTPNGASATAAAQDGAVPASVRLNQPGPQSELITGRVGLWDVTETLWEKPGATPVTTTGLVAERFMMGSLLQEMIRPPADTAHTDVKRTDLLTFNRVEGRWDYVSFDARFPAGLMSAWSQAAGDGSTIDVGFAPFAFIGPESEPTGRLLRMEETIDFLSPDHDVKDQYFTLADGTGERWLAHRYDYTRRA